MKIILLILLFIFFSNNTYAFDYCNELKNAIEICRIEIQHVDSSFDAYLEHCVGENWIYDTVEHFYIPENKDNVDVRCFSSPYLTFKFTMCLREHHFDIGKKK